MARLKKVEPQITFETTEEELKKIFGEEVEQITKQNVVLGQEIDTYFIKNKEWQKQISQTEYEKVRTLLLGDKNFVKSKLEIRREGFININTNLL